MSVKQQATEQIRNRCHYCGGELTRAESTHVVAVFPQESGALPYAVRVCEPCSEHHWELHMQAEFAS